MSVRSWMALLLLTNYLLIAGMGSIMQPYEQQTLLMVQTSYEGQSYRECRYLRMDGLEEFLTESLRIREQKDHRPLGHSILIEVNGIDMHCLLSVSFRASPPDVRFSSSFMARECHSSLSEGVYGVVSPPPWIA